jgi:hypothetical protein
MVLLHVSGVTIVDPVGRWSIPNSPGPPTSGIVSSAGKKTAVI